MWVEVIVVIVVGATLAVAPTITGVGAPAEREIFSSITVPSRSQAPQWSALSAVSMPSCTQ